MNRTRDPLLRCQRGSGEVVSRSVLAQSRLVQAREALADCHLCEHHCGVNRLVATTGVCRAGATARIFSAQVEVADELELIPVFAIAFSGCDLRCDFCITGKESWNPELGRAWSPQTVALQTKAASQAGARTVMILGGEPTVHLPTALEIVALLPDDLFLVWKTNAHGSANSRALLDGLFDCWVADYKFGNDRCALRLSRTPNYTQAVQENLRWASLHSDLIVRHLLMPGHGECCWKPVAQWLANELPGIRVNLRCGFWPAWQANRHQELRQRVASAEEKQAWALARALGLRLTV